MPERYPHTNRAKNTTLGQAAAKGMVISLSCAVCRRVVHFWAADLVKTLPPTHQVHVPPFACSKCGTKDYINVTWEIPNASRLTTLTVRRPVRQITRWLWRNEKA